MISPSVLFATEKKFGKGDSSKENTNHSPANAGPQTEFFLLLPACVTPSNSRISYEYQNILSTMDNVYVTKLRQATAHNDHLSIMALHHMRKNSFGLREPVPMRFISKIVLSTSNGVFFPKDILDLPPLFTNSARSASDPNNFVPQLNAEIFPDLVVNYLCKIAILVF